MACFVCGEEAQWKCSHCHKRMYCGYECQAIDLPLHMTNELVESGFHLRNLDKETVDNTAFRRVLYTTKEMQLVVQYLEPGQDVGIEVHKDATQFVRISRGLGMAMMGKRLVELKQESAIMIPAGTRHNIWAKEDGSGLWMYVLYSPPQH